MSTAEQHRLDEAKAGVAPWRRWGTYLSERAWGSVREDYSADGDAWAYFPFDHARSRAYRWSDDGLAGWCNDEQTICLSVALWNGRDRIIKERPYGVANEEGNHGEDVKDYWFYTDNLPSHAYASMVYKYPHAAFPYDDLLHTNQQRGPGDDEYELFEALREQWLQQRYFDVEVAYAKDGPEDVYCRITVTNHGPDAAPIHVLPQLWYRNSWSWDPDQERPRITACGDGAARTSHPKLGQRWFRVTTSGEETPRLVTSSTGAPTPLTRLRAARSPQSCRPCCNPVKPAPSPRISRPLTPRGPPGTPMPCWQTASAKPTSSITPWQHRT